MSRRTLLGFILLLCTIFVGYPAATRQANPQAVSVVQLIANPDKYDSRPVTVIGCLKFDGERIVLFLGCEDARHHVTINGLWVNPTAQMSETLSKLDGNYVMLVGTFAEYHSNTLHLSVGEIKDIQEALLWSPNSTSH